MRRYRQPFAVMSVFMFVELIVILVLVAVVVIALRPPRK
jgi:cbb3-type cytochrome oxidase subunit 3